MQNLCASEVPFAGFRRHFAITLRNATFAEREEWAAVEIAVAVISHRRPQQGPASNDSAKNSKSKASHKSLLVTAASMRPPGRVQKA